MTTYTLSGVTVSEGAAQPTTYTLSGVSVGVLSANSITGGVIRAADAVTIQLSNASASGKTLAALGAAITATAQDANSITFNAMDLLTFANRSGDFDTNIPITVTDGGESASINLQISPDSGFEVGAVAALTGIWSDAAFSGLAIADLYHVPTLTDSNWPNGSVAQLETEQTLTIYIQDQTDGVWSATPFNVVIPGSGQAPDNVAPTANPQTFSISEAAQNGASVGQFVAADSDGTIAANGYSISGSVLAIANGGAITLANNAGLTAGTPITATVTFTDDDGATGTATVTVNVTAASNQAPTANPQTFSISEAAQNGASVGQFVAADSDGTIAANGYSITGSVLAIANGGAITLANNAGLSAGTPITATVTFTDDDGATGTATVTVNVTAASNQAPTANPQTFSIFVAAQNGASVGQFVAADSDGTIAANGYSISGSVLAIADGGAITLANNSGLTAGTPITAIVTFTDDGGATGTATVTVNVTVDPDLPVITYPQPLIVVIPSEYKKLMSSHIAVQKWMKLWSAVDTDDNTLEILFNIPQVMPVNDSPVTISAVAVDSANRVQTVSSTITIQLLSAASSLALLSGGTPDRFEMKGVRYYQVDD